MKTLLNYVQSPDGITLTLIPQMEIHSIIPSHANYKKIVDFCNELKNNNLNKENYEVLQELIKKPISYNNKYYNEKKDYIFLTKSNELVFYKADTKQKYTIIQKGLIDRFQYLLDRNLPIGYFINFLSNLMSNPSERCRQQLYRFLKSNELPITPDGCFLGYKYVSTDYTDIYSHSFDNSIGSIVEMKRKDVDDDPNVYCSHGLHACSFAYLTNINVFGRSVRVMVTKINPADVVSIPFDYNNSKIRCCKYEVVDELPAYANLDSFMPKYASNYIGDEKVSDLNKSLINWYLTLTSFNFSEKDEDIKLIDIEAALKLQPVSKLTDVQISDFYKAFPWCRQKEITPDIINAEINSPNKILKYIFECRSEVAA